MPKLSILLSLAFFACQTPDAGFADLEQEALETSAETQELAAEEKSTGPFGPRAGHYEGRGTWTDSTGRSGTLRWTTDFVNDSEYDNAIYDDGRNLSSTVTFARRQDNSFDVTVTLDGQIYVVGYGACSQRSCGSSNITPVSKYIEVARYNRHGLSRQVSFLDLATNVWTFVDVDQRRDSN